MKTLDELILAIQMHNRYPDLLTALKNSYPVIPTYDYRSNNTEEWKANSLRKEGFDLCLAVLKITLE